MQTTDTCPYSVLMSIYKNENPAYLIQALDSMLNQTVSPSEIVIVKDGPLTLELENVLSDYDSEHSGLFKFVSYEKTMDWAMPCTKECSLALMKSLHAWIQTMLLVLTAWKSSLPLSRMVSIWLVVMLLNLSRLLMILLQPRIFQKASMLSALILRDVILFVIHL